MELTTEIQYGQPAELLGQVVDPDGNPVGLRDFGDAKISVTVVDSKGSTSPITLSLNKATGQFSGKFSPTAGVSKAIFDVTLRLTTVSGQILKPIEQRIEEQVALGAEYPSLNPAKVVFTELAGPGGTAVGLLNFEGSALGDSEVCLVSQNVLNDPLPERIESYEWSTNSSDDCVMVPKGGNAQLEILVANPSGAEGLVDGTLGISVAPIGGDARQLQVPFEMQSTWPPNELIRSLVLIVLLLLSTLLPWLFLYLLNLRNARLIAGSYLKRNESHVLISSFGVRGPVTSGNPQPATLDIQPTEYQFVGAADRPKSYLDVSGVELIGKPPLNPFGTPKVEVEALAGYTVITNHDLDNDLGRTWFVVVSDVDLLKNEPNGIPAKLVSFKRSTGFDNQSILERNIEITNSPVWSNLPNYIDKAATKVAPTPVQAPSGGKKFGLSKFGKKGEGGALVTPPPNGGGSIWDETAIGVDTNGESSSDPENTRKDSCSGNSGSGLDWS